LRFVALGLPAGLSVDPDDGSISGTLPTGTGGSYTVTLLANDGTNSIERTFLWTLIAPITITDPGDQSGAEGQTPPTLQIVADDATSGTLHYAAEGLPPGLGIDPDTGEITGTLAAGSSGSYSVRLVVENGGASASLWFNWEVTSPVTISVPDD
jgi:hypothetical protein